MKNIVNITKTSGYEDVYEKIETSLSNLETLDIYGRVLIKINLCDSRAPSSGAITHPLFLDALLKYLRTNHRNLDIVVIESDATVGRPNIIAKWFGIDNIIKKWDANWYNLSEHPRIKKKINGYFFSEIEIAEIFDDYDYFISLPKLKTHTLTKITASLKNQFGCLPHQRKVEFHNNLDEIIADANLAMKPDLCIVDGILSLGGGGAIYGIPIKSNIIISGTDPVSVDSVCSKLIGYNPRRIGHIEKSEKLGVGTQKYIINGDILNIKDLDFNFEISFWKENILKFGKFINGKHTLKKYLSRSRKG
ncbi:MAG: DUF362 domain-containing protein [Methanosarcinales archaeon]|nr:DUF362 domain-containing protein [Methanosarcinales archaeon]